ncbi:MAG: ornithine carbamoyltransferase [Candidatus Eisenbacteria bacterium]|nr:ornithine carbamoyltransferase [Candidatus Eisenbacteria bacterium]MCC7141276.1 ornithine carbamoyltransferase [Candidatus Eisenbacteria bacterium]
MSESRDFLTLSDFDRKTLDLLLDLATTLKDAWRKGRPEPRLAGKVLGLMFMKPSLRTRISFEVGMRQLGGHALYITDQEVGLGKRESIHDVGNVMSRFLDGIMIRTFAQSQVEELAQHSSIPIINGLTDLVHPCQVFCDLLTTRENGFDLDAIKVVYLGDGNNMVNSWIDAACAYNFEFVFSGPEGYDPDAATLARAKGRRVSIVRSPEEAIRGAQVVYTDTWTSMGQEAEAEKRRKVFPPYQLNAKLLKLADPKAIVLHCLPAHRGEEITDEVMDGPQSVVFDQAENRLHGQKAILAWALGGHGE